MRSELLEFENELKNRRIYFGNSRKMVEMLYRNRDKLNTLLERLSNITDDIDQLIRSITDKNRSAFIKMVIEFNRVIRRLEEIERRFGDDAKTQIEQHPELIWYRTSIEKIVDRGLSERLMKIKWLKETYGIEAKESWPVLNLSRSHIDRRFNMLISQYHLDPREYPIRLVYTKKKLEWTFTLLQEIFQIPKDQVVEFCRERFGKSFIDKLILDHNRVKQRYEILKYLVEDRKGFLLHNIKYLTSDIPPREYLERVLYRDQRISDSSRKVSKTGIDYVKELGLELPSYRYLHVEYDELLRKLEILERIGYERKEVLTRHRYVLRFSSDTLRKKIETLIEHGENPTLFKIMNSKIF